ncbi:hypothetical protein BCD67_24890 [Oscillatoriales cyanobacterium USR001]|nr:hypothetical protein BCD67_24890 [Oscillatoriales cyanobacterium USR001]
MKLKHNQGATVPLAEKSDNDIDALERQYRMPSAKAFTDSLTVAASNPQSKLNKTIDKVAFISFTGASTCTIAQFFFEEEPAYSAPDPNVQQVVTTVTDTVPLLTTITMIVFSAGLGPWAARTCLHWLGSIMRGSV